MLKILGFYFGRRKQPTPEQILKQFNKSYTVCMKTYDSKLIQHLTAYNNIIKKLDELIKLVKEMEV